MEKNKIIEGLKISIVGSAAVAAGFVSFPLFAAGVAALGLVGSGMFVKTAGAAAAGATAGAAAAAGATAGAAGATATGTVLAATAVLSNTGAAVAAGGSILTAVGAGKVTSVAVNGLHNFGRDIAQNYEEYKESELIQTRKNNKELRERLNALSQELEVIKSNLID